MPLRSIPLLMGLCLLGQVAQAADAVAPAPLSDQCVASMRNVYRFYYHEVHPNPDPACHTNQKMGDGTLNEMQGIIAELKTSCPATVIAQVNQSLQLETKTS